MANSGSSTSLHAGHNLSWQQTMLRIRDPKVTIPFYKENFGMRLIHTYNFDGFSLYFLDSPERGDGDFKNSQDSETYLWTMQGTCLELTHNHGSENDPNFRINNGNSPPQRFGHIAFNCNDVQEAVNKLDRNKVKFHKRPEDGKMRNMAFALDPDGYWIEICQRGSDCPYPEIPYNLSQTMIRINNPEKSLKFYCEYLGMKLLCKRAFSDFTLFFLAHIPDCPLDIEGAEGIHRCKALWKPVLELTYNHPTLDTVDAQNQETSKCTCAVKCSCKTDNNECKCKDSCHCVEGFGHIGMLCTGLEELCQKLQAQKVAFSKLPHEGRMRGLAFALDPDGYKVELIERGAYF